MASAGTGGSVGAAAMSGAIVSASKLSLPGAPPSKTPLAVSNCTVIVVLSDVSLASVSTQMVCVSGFETRSPAEFSGKRKVPPGKRVLRAHRYVLTASGPSTPCDWRRGLDDID